MGIMDDANNLKNQADDKGWSDTAKHQPDNRWHKMQKHDQQSGEQQSDDQANG
jgi:hypothetical protein